MEGAEAVGCEAAGMSRQARLGGSGAQGSSPWVAFLKCGSEAEESVLEQQLGVQRLGLAEFVAQHVVEQVGGWQAGREEGSSARCGAACSLLCHTLTEHCPMGCRRPPSTSRILTDIRRCHSAPFPIPYLSVCITILKQ